MKKSEERMGLWIVVFGALASLLIWVPPVEAVTVDEIVSMHKAGVAPKIIIEVIEATGLEEEITWETLENLEKAGLDEIILDYLAGYLPESQGEENLGEESSEGARSNLMGGEGFHHGQRYHNPPSSHNNEEYWKYWEGVPFSDLIPQPWLPGTIYIFEPPVYFLYDDPYYRAWRAPRFYRYRRGYWDDGRYVIYDWRRHLPYPYGYYHYWWDECPWWYDGEWGGKLRGRVVYRDGKWEWDGSFDTWFYDDGISLHFRF